MVYLPKQDLLVQRRQPVASSAVETHTYSVKLAGGRTDALETALAEGIEDRIVPILDKLDVAPSGPLHLLPEERVRLSRYLGTLYTRVPAMATPFVRVMNEMVSQPGWQGLDNAYIARLVALCQLSKKAAEKTAWDVVLGYLRPGATPPTLSDDSRLHRVAVGATIVAAFVYSTGWTLFRMAPNCPLVLPDRPMAIMGRLNSISASADDLFFAVPLSPTGLLVGMNNSPLAEQVVPGGFSYPFLREAWARAFNESKVEFADPSVFHAHLALNFAHQEIYGGSEADHNRIRGLAGRTLSAKVVATRP